jgi:hypothetical protein
MYDPQHFLILSMTIADTSTTFSTTTNIARKITKQQFVCFGLRA